jgi:lipopolysaccharide biosynthesis regulator YciM
MFRHKGEDEIVLRCDRRLKSLPSQERNSVRAAFLSLRGLVYLMIAVVGGAGIGIGGYWVYETYFPTPLHCLERAQEKYDKGEQVFSGDAVAAEPYFKDAAAYLDKMAKRTDPSDKDMVKQGVLLQAKVLWRLGDVARARDKGGPDGVLEQGRKQAQALGIYKEILVTLDKHNVDAAGALLDYYMRRDDLVHAEEYAEIVAAYELKEGEEPTRELETRQAAAHFLIAQRCLHGQTPRPAEALDHIKAIEALPKLQEDHKKRWREYAVEAEALRIRLEMARKREVEGDVTRDDTARSLKAVLAEGVNRARNDLAAPGVVEDPDKPPIPVLAHNQRPNAIRGLLDFLTIAVEASTTKEEALDRADLLIAVSKQLVTAKNASATTIKTASAHLAKLPTAVDRPAVDSNDPRLRPLPGDWSPIEGRLREVLQLADAAGATVEPDVWLELARRAHKEHRWKDVEDSAKKGLESARKNKNGEDYASVQNLHAEAAWALFEQGNTASAADHLSDMRKRPGHAGTANLIDGLAAVRESRFEVGVRHLLAAQEDVRYADSMLTLPALTRAFQGLGDPANALIYLKKIDSLYNSPARGNEEERGPASSDRPSADSVVLEAMRCSLALNQPGQAVMYRTRLAGKPLEPAARILFTNHYIALGRTESAKGNPLEARDFFDAARAEINALPESVRSEPAVVWAEAMETAGRQDRKPTQGATGTHAENAEKLLRDYAGRRNDLESNLLLVRWLETRGRSDEALTLLSDLDRKFGNQKKVIESVRARLTLSRSWDRNIAGLVATLQGSNADTGGDALQYLYLTNPIEDGLKARTITGAVLGQQDSTVLSHFWSGIRAQSEGAFADAAGEYGHALSPGPYRSEAQIGLLTSLIALATKGDPKTSADLIDRLRSDNPTDPALLIAYAEMARRMDNIQGNNSMQGALNELEHVLTPSKRQAIAADLLARGYYAAGRPDLAQSEAVRAFKIDAAYAPALHIAAFAAAAQGNYEGSLRYAEELERTLYGTPAAKRENPIAAAPCSILDRPQPTPADAKFLRAEALKKLNRRRDAHRMYQELIDKHPALSAGYLGLAVLQAEGGELQPALATIRDWRAKNPKDPAGTLTESRILARSGQSGEALRVARSFAGNDPELLASVSSTFTAAGAYNTAETLAEEALKSAKDKTAVIAARLALADAYRTRAATKQGAERKAAVEKALTEYKAVWELSPGNPAAGYPLAALQAREHNEADAAYAVVQDVRKGMHGERMVSGDRLTLEQLEVLGDVYRLSNHPGDAVMLFREAVEQRYRHEPRILLQFGLACRDQKLWDDAAAVFAQAEKAAVERSDRTVAEAARTARASLEEKR